MIYFPVKCVYLPRHYRVSVKWNEVKVKSLLSESEMFNEKSLKGFYCNGNKNNMDMITALYEKYRVKKF